MGAERKGQRLAPTRQPRTAPVSHEAADKMLVAAQAVELCHGDLTPELPGGGQGGLEPRAAVQGV
jgi:hypothetical protein